MSTASVRERQIAERRPGLQDRSETRALFGQVMALVAVTVALSPSAPTHLRARPWGPPAPRRPPVSDRNGGLTAQATHEAGGGRSRAGGARPARRGAVHVGARRNDHRRRAAVDPDRSVLERLGAVMGRQRLCADVRRFSAARRTPRRPQRTALVRHPARPRAAQPHHPDLVPRVSACCSAPRS